VGCGAGKGNIPLACGSQDPRRGSKTFHDETLCFAQRVSTSANSRESPPFTNGCSPIPKTGTAIALVASTTFSFDGLVEKHLPLLTQLRTLRGRALRRDVSAGLTTGVMLVPQAMAYALLAGLDPATGLYAATLPTAIYALLGRSGIFAVGPSAVVAMLTAGAVAPIAGPNPVAYAALASLLMLLVGLLQVLSGLLRFGRVERLLSHAVVLGFTAAVAILIGASQLKHALGLSLPRGSTLANTLGNTFAHLHQTHLITAAIAIGSVFALARLKKKAPQVPRFLLLVGAGMALTALFGLKGLGVHVVGEVPAGLPSLQIPDLDIHLLILLLPSAITIAIVGAVETFSLVKRYESPDRQKLNADSELIALGLANFGGAFFQGMPVTGGFSRTAVNVEAGARTGISALTTAGVVVVSLIWLTPLFSLLPTAVLAAIILSAVAGLINTQAIRAMFCCDNSGVLVMVSTFLATIFLGVEWGMFTGLSLQVLAWRIGNARNKPCLNPQGRLVGIPVNSKAG